MVEEAFSARVLGVEDEAFVQLHDEFMDGIIRLLAAKGDGREDVYSHWGQLKVIADKLHERAEELLEETFD